MKIRYLAITAAVVLGGLFVASIQHAKADEWDAAKANATQRCGADRNCADQELAAARLLSILGTQSNIGDKIKGCAVTYYLAKGGKPGADLYRFTYECARS